MAHFLFRLKPLLSVREAERDERRAHLAESFAAERKLQDRQAELQQELNEQQQCLRSATALGRLDIDLLRTANHYETVVRGEMRVLSERQKSLAEEIELRRQAVLVADREVHVLEKLRERQYEQFHQQQARAEMKQIDEVAGRVAGHAELAP